MDSYGTVMIICEILLLIAVLVFVAYRIKKHIDKKKKGSKTEKGRNNDSKTNGRSGQASAQSVNSGHALKPDSCPEVKREAGAETVTTSITDIKNGCSSNLSVEEPETLEEYLDSLPELDEEGLPLQIRHEFADETKENAALCDSGAAKAANGKFLEAFSDYRKAALAGSERGMSMCAFLLTVPGLDASVEEKAVDEVIGWIMQLSNVRQHPFGKGLELLLTAIYRPGCTDGMSENEIGEMLEDVRETMATALIKAKDPFAHYLLLLMYAGAVESIVPEFCEDDKKYEKLLIQTSRFCNEFCFDDNIVSRELSMIFRDKSLFVRGLACLAERLYNEEMFEEAFSCYSKAIELFGITGDDCGMAEIICTRCADMYVNGKGVEKNVKGAEEMLEKAAGFADSGTPDEYTLYVAKLVANAKDAESRLSEFVAQIGNRPGFGIDEIEELTSRLQELSEKSAEKRKRREEEEEREKRQREEEIPPLVGNLEEIGSSRYFVSNGMYYKVFDVSDNGKKITVDRGYLYGIGEYKIKEK